MMIFKYPEPAASVSDIRKRVFIFFSIVSFGSLFQYLYGYVLYSLGGYSYPFTSPLFLPEDRFMDFFNPPWWTINGNPNNYAPFSWMLSFVYSRTIDFGNGPKEAINSLSGLIALLSMVISLLISLASIAQITVNIAFKHESLRKRFIVFCLIFGSMVISYPVVFSLDRGNYVAFTFMFLCLSVAQKNNLAISSFLFASALSLKFYLTLLLVPLFQSKKYYFVVCVLLGVLLQNILSLFIINWVRPDALEQFRHLTHTQGYAGWMLAQKMGWSSHLLNLFYPFAYLIYLFKGSGDLRVIIDYTRIIEKIYMLVVFLPAVTVGTWFIGTRVQDLYGRLFFVTVLIVLVAPFIGNYSLVFLFIYVPYVLQLPSKKFGDIVCVLLALCLIPKCYFTVFIMGVQRVTLQSFLNPMLLLALLMIPACYNIHKD